MHKDQLPLPPVTALNSALALVVALAAAAASAAEVPQKLAYRIVAAHAHNVADYTQGLVIRDGRLFESTGGYGRSALLEKELRSGKTLRRSPLSARFFGEGIAVLDDAVIQLTWRGGRGFVYDRRFEPRGEFRYSGEGWGLAQDGARLFMSDGTATLRVLDAATLAETARLAVHDRGRPVALLNELEYARGNLYANIWLSDRIARIDPGSGEVTGWLDLARLKTRFEKPTGWNAQDHVLNGIAYDAASGHFFVTGKCWPRLFELELSDPQARSHDPPIHSAPTAAGTPTGTVQSIQRE